MTGGGARGVPISFERRKTSKDRLQIDWDFPASLQIEDQTGQHTVVGQRMYALPLDEAFDRLAAEDLRPLLVLRECGRCAGTDDALLSRTLDNEKTLLLAKFFHCVKLKEHVVEEDHSFHRLFDGDRPPHLLLATHDGGVIAPLPGTQSQKELWQHMLKILDLTYEKDAELAVKGMLKLLSHYDHLDSMEDGYLEQMDIEIERRGPKSPKLRRLKAKLDTIREKKEAALAREQELLDLGLKAEIAADARSN